MSRRIESLVADIADDVSVDWQLSDGSPKSGELVKQFRIIAAIGADREQHATGTAGFERVVEVALWVAVSLAVTRVVVAAAVAATTVPFRVGPVAMLALLFGGAGLALILGGRDDRRALTLGAFFMLVSSSWTHPYLTRGADSGVASFALFLRSCPPESFLALSLWAFVWEFPSAPRTRAARRVGSWFMAVSLLAGVALLLANGVAGVIGAPLKGAVERGASNSAFWPVVMTLGIPAFPYLFWKSRTASVEERNRATWLGASIAAGLAPVVAAVIGSAFIPALIEPPLRNWIGAGFGVALIAVVGATAYAVKVKRMLDVHLVVRRALQHSLARRAVWAASIAPLAYAVARLYLGRERTITALVSEQTELVLMSAVGFAALTFRPQLLRGVDCWFRRDDVDYSDAIARLVEGLNGKRSIRDLQMTLSREVALTLRATHASVLVLSDAMTAFISMDGRTPALPAGTTLAGLVGATRREIHLASVEAHDTVRMLPALERNWIMESDTEWLFPLIGSSGTLVGLLCLGEGRSGLAYSDRDRAFASAVTSQVALRMENLSLRRWVGESSTSGSLPDSARLMDWQNEPAMQCPGCLSVGAPTAKICPCGTPMVPGSVPAVLNGKFGVERVLGSGGMGIVYAATDIELHRRVAIKTMPQVTPIHVGRMQREARAMAAVRHPNLAMIYSVERWRDVPLLVVEFLDGGTLAESIRACPLGVDEVLDLGIVLADVLDRMHTSNLLHRDIKPSNIGYSGDGVIKLLDFGLAAMLATDNEDAPHRAIEPKALAALLEVASPTATLTLSQQILGTPLYLSPEGLAGDPPDQSFDLWSLALVLYEALAGRHPLAGYPVVEAMRRVRSVRLPDVRDFRADCPPPLAALLNDALALSLERRPQTAAEFRVLLQAIPHGMPSASFRVGRPSLY